MQAKQPGAHTLTGTITDDTVVNPEGLTAALTVNIAEPLETVTYLSDLDSTDEKFSWAGKWTDAAVEGKAWTLVMNGVVTNQVKGVSFNATGYVTYAIPTGAESFESYVGITGAASGKCTFAVNLDGEDATPENIRGVVFTRETEAEKVTLDVQGKSTITIRINQSGNSVTGANGAWADAKFLLRDEPQADYTAVDAAVAAAGEIDRTAYTVASCKAVDAAVAAVVRGKFASEQENVDAMAAAITAAIEAVVRDLTADEQATVDGYAAAIEAAISALTPKAVEMELTISTGMVTKAAAAEGKYDITWNARILLGEELKVEDINAAGVKFKNYGVYYGTGKDVLNDYKNATADQIRQVVFDKGEDIDVYTAYGFRLKNVVENRVRAAMFYVEYELNGQSYILLSTVDEVRVVAVAAE